MLRRLGRFGNHCWWRNHQRFLSRKTDAIERLMHRRSDSIPNGDFFVNSEMAIRTVLTRNIQMNRMHISLLLVLLLPEGPGVTRADKPVRLTESDSHQHVDDGEAQPIRSLAPLPNAAPFPDSNPPDPAKTSLGKQLFFDPRLSGNNTTSCATCHQIARAFGDGLPQAKGAKGKPLPRNTQTLWNVAFYSSFLWDGRASSLEEQALIPIQNPDELNQDLEELEQELIAIPGYVREFQKVFQAAPNRDLVAKALAAFQRTLITEAAPFDRYLLGDKSAITEKAKQGYELFKGEADCVRCHHGPLLSDGKFYRLGVSYRDYGRGKITHKKEDRYRFRTPSLRNVAQTAPYMHNGSQKTLDDVVFFYLRGVLDIGHDGLKPDVSASLGESFSDIPLLVEFLKSLSGKMPEITLPLLPSVLKNQVETSISPAQPDEIGFLVHTVESPYQVGQTKIRILLPDRVQDKKKYPVVYVLPVEAKDGSRYGNGLREIKSHELHNKFDAIFVAPTFSHLPWFADHPSRQEIRQESYLLKVAIPFVEQTYPTHGNSAGRLLMGFSKSGWGAWSLLLRHPKLFARAAAFDAPMMMTQIGKYGNGPIFGTQENFERYQISRLLSENASRLSDRHRLILTGRGNFYSEHQQVHQLMKEQRISHQYRDVPKRKHHWNSGWVAEAVELLFESPADQDSSR